MLVRSKWTVPSGFLRHQESVANMNDRDIFNPPFYRLNIGLNRGDFFDVSSPLRAPGSPGRF